MKVNLLGLVCCIFATVFGTAQNSWEKEVVNQFMQTVSLKNAAIGIKITDTETSETLLAYQNDKCLIPASTLKLVTTASALNILGENYTFKTHIGFTGNISNNILLGDLVIIGGGDPALGSEYFQNHYFAPHFLETWAKKIKATGIKNITGNLVFDSSVYDNEPVPPTWIWEDIGNYYGASANAFTVYDNTFRITFSSSEFADETTKIINYYPKIEGIKLQNYVISSDENRDLAYVFGSPFDDIREIRGTIPKNRKAFTIKAAVHQPEKLLATEFKSFLAREGIFFSGEILFKNIEKSEFQNIYTQHSPRLSEIIKIINHESVNLFSEHLIKQIAFEHTGIGARKSGIEIITGFWKKKGLKTHELIMEDGSGLSHFNAVSPDFFTELLLYMKNDSCFLNSLPLAGQGTLYSFNPEAFPNKTLQAKSGSMTRVRCYSGYLQTKQKKLAFSVMTNHFSGTQSSVIKSINALFQEILSHEKD